MPFFTSLFYFFLGGTAGQVGGGNYNNWMEKRFPGSTKIFPDLEGFLTAYSLMKNKGFL